MSAAGRQPPLALAGPGDTARAEIAVPLAPAALADFLADVERLFRLNPLLAIESWRACAGGFHFVAANESNGRRIDAVVAVERAADGSTLLLRYATGLKRATRLAVTASAGGARLVVTEHYAAVEDPADPRLAEVDRSLVPWVAALHRHLRARRRWGWLPGWRWWHERFLAGLAPRQRRIVRLLVWISLLEFIAFLGLVLVWNLAAQR